MPKRDRLETLLSAALLKQMADESTGVGRAEMAALRQEVADMAGDLAEAMRAIPGYKQLIDGIGDMSRAELAAFRERLDDFAEDVAEAMGRLPLNGDTGERGEPGPQGLPGVMGLPGERGEDGAPGRDGVGVVTARMDGGDLVIVMTTGEEVRVGRVRGADGRDGPRGPAGPIGRGIPEGGTTGQVLAKAGDGDYDTEWVNSGGGPGGGVTSVNGQSGVVVLDADDVGAATPATVPKTATGTVDFGATHGGTLATVDVAAIWVTGSSVIVVAPGGASADHDAEDVLIEEIQFAVTAVNNGVGFTVTASAPNGTWGRYTINAVGL
jgi:hypothetical protein